MNNERKLFEAEMRGKLAPRLLGIDPFEAYPDGTYKIQLTLMAWEAWQARATLQTKPVAYGFPDNVQMADYEDLDFTYIVCNKKRDDFIQPLFTHAPNTVPVEKYNQLLDALKLAEAKIKALPRFNFLLNANGNGVAKWENKSGDWIERYEVTNITEQAIAEAEGKS